MHLEKIKESLHAQFEICRNIVGKKSEILSSIY